MSDYDLQEAKHRLPLPALMSQLGLGEHAKRSARCGFHDDQKNSFSVTQNKAGRWRWKCFAGCGQGDEITFLEKHFSISTTEAIKRFKEMAGVSGTSTRKKPGPAALPLNWRACVEAFTETYQERLADWRGLSGRFVSWLKQIGLVGLFKGCIAFPVHDAAGNVVAVHYRVEDSSWRYYPAGAKMRPLVIGELAAGETLHVFESQWDAFAFMDVSGERSGILITRGSANGALVAGLIPPGATVYAWKQNDELKNGMRAGDEWLNDVAAHAGTKVLWPKTPEPHKDLNNWTCAGATADNLLAAIVNAQTISEINNQVQADLTADDGAAEPGEDEKEERIEPFPVECLPPTLRDAASCISELCGVPLSMVAPMLLALASIAIGKGLYVHSAAGFDTWANIFLLVCKVSGTGGTITAKKVIASLVGMQKTLRREFENDQQPRIKSELKDVELQIKAIDKELDQNTKKKPEWDKHEEQVKKRTELEKKRAKLERRNKPKVLYVTNTTREGLADRLAENYEQLAQIDTDAADALNIITGAVYQKNSGETHTSEATWLKSYSGEPLVESRRGKETQQLTAPCLSVLFVTTPLIVEKLFTDPRLTSGGFLARFLVCDPMARPVPRCSDGVPREKKVDISVLQRLEADFFAIYSRYGALAEAEADAQDAAAAETDPIKKAAALAAAERIFCKIEMTTRANKLIDEDWNRFCAICEDGKDHPFEARWTENAIKIALDLHTWECIARVPGADGKLHSEARAHEQMIAEPTMRDAIKIRDWFAEHQKRLRSAETFAAEDKAWRIAEALMNRNGRNVGIGPRDLYTGRRVCRASAEAKLLLSHWEAEGRVEKFKRKVTKKDGRTTWVDAYRLPREQ